LFLTCQVFLIKYKKKAWIFAFSILISFYLIIPLDKHKSSILWFFSVLFGASWFTLVHFGSGTYFINFYNKIIVNLYD